MTMIVGPTAIQYVGLLGVKSGLVLEKNTGMFLTRGVKASYLAKDALGAAGVQYNKKPISRRTRIPIEELITMFAEFVEAYRKENENVLRENITDY